MQLGDYIKHLISPMVKGTKFESCDACEGRRVALNKLSGFLSGWFARITCPCLYRKIAFKLIGKSSK